MNAPGILIPAVTFSLCVVSILGHPSAHARPVASGDVQAAGLQEQLVAIYRRSLDVKVNQDEAGYPAVFSHSKMDEFRGIMRAMQLSTFTVYMQRVADMERRRERVVLVPQAAEEAGDHAILQLRAPRACGQNNEQDCLIVVTFVPEDGTWKIDDERVVGVP